MLFGPEDESVYPRTNAVQQVLFTLERDRLGWSEDGNVDVQGFQFSRSNRLEPFVIERRRVGVAGHIDDERFDRTQRSAAATKFTVAAECHEGCPGKLQFGGVSSRYDLQTAAGTESVFDCGDGNFEQRPLVARWQ